MERRRLLASAGVALGTALSGCLIELQGTGDRGTSPSPSPSPSPSEPPDTPTADPPSYHEAANEPDPDLPIRVENCHDTVHTPSITVARESGETVHEATHEVAPGTDREVYNLKEADPDGIETFTVEAVLGDRTESVSVETNACYAAVLVEITEEGGLSPTCVIC